MAKRFHIDSLDRRILGMLASDVRISFSEIARKCNVTASAIHQRIQKLHEHKVLEPKTFRVEPKAIDFHALAYWV